jgi:tetratricopeptide (TPR) repeat protein
MPVRKHSDAVRKFGVTKLEASKGRPYLTVPLLLVLVSAFFLWASQLYLSEVDASLSDQLTKQQLYPRATEAAQTSIQRNRYNGYAYYYLGYILLTLERYDQAIDVFLTGLPYMPHLPQMLKMLAQAYFFAGQYKEAVAVLDRYLAMDPEPRAGKEMIFRLWAQGLSYSQDFGRAALALAKADSFEQFRSELLQTRILNAVLINQVVMADYYYRLFKHFLPEGKLDPTALFSSSLAASKMDSLIRFLELNRLRGAVDATAEKILAMAYAKVGRMKEAIAVLVSAQRLVPNDPDIPLFLGDAYAQQGEKAKAIECYKRHLTLLPQSAFKKELLQRYPELEPITNATQPPDAMGSATLAR